MNRDPHILHTFDHALDGLRSAVLMMASLTQRNLETARQGLFERDDEFCNLTIAEEDEVNQLEVAVDGDGVEILTRFQPVASDLRQVISTMKLSSNLERVGDQAVKIARRARKLNHEPALDETELLQPMFREAIALFDDSVKAYADGDVELARSLRLRDRKLDGLNAEIANQITVKMATDPERIAEYLNLIFIARHLERVGDHAKNIGEDAVYAAEAEDIRHLKEVFG